MCPVDRPVTDSFEMIGDKAVFRGKEMSWSVRIDAPVLDLRTLKTMIASGDARSEIEATSRIRPEDLSEAVEVFLAIEMSRPHPRHAILNIAASLAFGKTKQSLDALQTIFRAHLESAIEIAAQAACSLYVRGRDTELRSLQTAIPDLPIESVAAILRIAATDRRIPATGWPRSALTLLAESQIPGSDMWAAHLLLRRGLRAGLALCEKRLSRGLPDRLAAISALEEGRAGSRRLLRRIAEGDPDDWIRFCAARAANFPGPRIAKLVRQLARHSNPYYRWIAIDHLNLLGPSRKAFVEAWKSSESDAIVLKKLGETAP